METNERQYWLTRKITAEEAKQTVEDENTIITQESYEEPGQPRTFHQVND